MPLSLIPQIFFDLIARVTPGIVFLICSYISIFGPVKGVNNLLETLAKKNFVNIWLVVFIFIVSYMLGFILHEIWGILFEKIEKKYIDSKKDESKKKSLKGINDLRNIIDATAIEQDVSRLPDIYIMHDHIRFFSESESYRLLKLRAETRLWQNTIIAFIFGLILNPIFWHSDKLIFMNDRLFFEIFLLAALPVLLKTRNRYLKYYYGGTCISWLLFNYPVNEYKKECNSSNNKTA